MKLGRLRRVDPRRVWAHEAHDMTPWLLDNADVLADALGIDLELTATEHPVGAFSLDLVGRDLTHNCVLIVENQLTPTDHAHLGQLITYAAGTEAGTVVWVAPAFRDEHREALALLNTLGGDRVRFFGVQLGVVAIGDSEPAPLFELHAQPNDWAAQTAATAQAASRTSGKAAAYTAFWTIMLERIHTEHPDWTNARNPGSQNWFGMRSQLRGDATYSLVFGQHHQLRSELYIDNTNPARVAAIYAVLHRHKDRIERTYGVPLAWDELPNRRASRIAAYSDGDCDILDTDRYDQYVTWFLDTQQRLRRAIDDILPQLRAELEATTTGSAQPDLPTHFSPADT